MTSVTYPSVSNHSGTYTTSYDSMARPFALVDNSSNTWASNVSYGPSNELLTLNSESRTYNSLLQLTSITVSSSFSQQYVYPTNGTNNGKAIQQNDLISGEQVIYQYDSLNRLTLAQTTSGSSTTWGQGFVYDGFGNLYQKNVTQGSAPTMSVTVDPTTNRISGQGYDANGNGLGAYPMYLGYDVENRVSVAGQYNTPQVLYAYDSGNRRVWRGTVNSSGAVTAQEMYYYGADGKKLGTYVAAFNPPGYSSYWTATDLQVHFGARRVAHWASQYGQTQVSLTWTTLDRVGSVRNAGGASSFYPYGEDKGTAAPNDQTKFATYTRDSATGLDYAMNRYYSSAWGRFGRPDPYKNSGGPELPQSWNRYTYVVGDPINLIDPQGTTFCFINPSTGAVESCYDSVDVSAGLDGGSGGGGKSGTTNIPTDPLGFSVQQAWALAKGYQQAVKNGVLNDCQALADFAADVADQAANVNQFVRDFGVLTPAPGSSTPGTGIAWNSSPVALNTGQASGYATQYQNTIPDNPATGWNGDQGHHFAAFFQFGYLHGAAAGQVLAFGMEWWQGTMSGVLNVGDVALGEVAAQIGADLASGHDMGAAANAIRGLCSH